MTNSNSSRSTLLTRHLLLAVAALMPACAFPQSQAGAGFSAFEPRQILQEVVPAAEHLGDREFVVRVTEELQKSYAQSLGRSAEPLISLSPRLLDDPEYCRNTRSLLVDARERFMIIGGEPAKDTDFPDCVAVATASKWCCSGTLIASNAVLSARHCPDGLQRVFVGTNVKRNGELATVIADIPAPGSRGAPTFERDIRVLILDHDITNALPRHLAPTGILDSPSIEKIRLAGFGATVSGGSYSGRKYIVDVPLVSKSCSGTNAAKYGCYNDTEFVAGKPLYGKDSCDGDSGGPAYVLSGSKWFLAGATSRMTKPGRNTPPCGDGGIYVRVDKFTDWLRSIPGIHWGNQ